MMTKLNNEAVGKYYYQIWPLKKKVWPPVSYNNDVLLSLFLMYNDAKPHLNL